jgi:hypothetical protein
MLRHLIFLVLFVTQFQLGWAAVSPYLEHADGGGIVADHFVQHDHQRSGDIQAASASEPGDAPQAAPPDCGTCHLAASMTLPTSLLTFGSSAPETPRWSSPPPLQSHSPPGPERPDRRLVAPDARFGGGRGVTTVS